MKKKVKTNIINTNLILIYLYLPYLITMLINKNVKVSFLSFLLLILIHLG